MTPSAFWPEALPWAQQAHQQTGVLTSVILAQWAIETAYGGPDWSPRNNPGNVGDTQEGGQVDYPTLAAGVAAYVRTMELGYYDAVRAATTWQAQALALGESPWASAHYASAGGGPGSALVWVIETYDLTQYDAPAPAPAPQEHDMALQMTDPESGKVMASDADGDLYVDEGGIPDLVVTTLGEHPTWAAGEVESAGKNPCVGLVPWKDPSGRWGYAYITQPSSGSGSLGPYSTYHIGRDGIPH